MWNSIESKQCNAVTIPLVTFSCFFCLDENFDTMNCTLLCKIAALNTFMRYRFGQLFHIFWQLTTQSMANYAIIDCESLWSGMLLTIFLRCNIVCAFLFVAIKMALSFRLCSDYFIISHWLIITIVNCLKSYLCWREQAKRKPDRAKTLKSTSNVLVLETWKCTLNEHRFCIFPPTETAEQWIWCQIGSKIRVQHLN